MSKPKKESQIEKERFELGKKLGGGILSYEVWGYQEDKLTVVTRYNLAYINHSIHAGDNGRVLVSTMPTDTTTGTLWGKSSRLFLRVMKPNLSGFNRNFTS